MVSRHRIPVSKVRRVPGSQSPWRRGSEIIPYVQRHTVLPSDVRVDTLMTSNLADIPVNQRHVIARKRDRLCTMLNVKIIQCVFRGG
jgi:hypothetical protein